jgi:hypothetical protein
LPDVFAAQREIADMQSTIFADRGRPGFTLRLPAGIGGGTRSGIGTRSDGKLAMVPARDHVGFGIGDTEHLIGTRSLIQPKLPRRPGSCDCVPAICAADFTGALVRVGTAGASLRAGTRGGVNTLMPGCSTMVRTPERRRRVQRDPARAVTLPQSTELSICGAQTLT